MYKQHLIKTGLLALVTSCVFTLGATAQTIVFGNGANDWTGANSTYAGLAGNNNPAFSITNDSGGPNELTVDIAPYSFTFNGTGDAIASATQVSTFFANNTTNDRLGTSSGSNTRIEAGTGFSLTFDQAVTIDSLVFRNSSGRTPSFVVEYGGFSETWANMPSGTAATITPGVTSGTSSISLNAGTEIFFALGALGDTQRSDGFLEFTVTVVPEPNSFALLVGGLGLLMFFRRGRTSAF